VEDVDAYRANPRVDDRLAGLDAAASVRVAVLDFMLSEIV
jgi:hypothetical protein